MAYFETSVRIEQYRVSEIAIFEIRHYHRELGHPYLSIIFYNKKVLRKRINNKLVLPNYSDYRYGAFIDTPEKYNYIELSVYKDFISNEEYNLMVCELLEEVTDYYQTNILFPYIEKLQNLSVEQVYNISNQIINKDFNRKSFIIQMRIKDFINQHATILDSDMKVKLMEIYKESYQRQMIEKSKQDLK